MTSSGQEQESSLITHLEALRRVMLRSLGALAIGIVPLFLVSPYVLDWFCKQIAMQSGVTLHYFSPMEVFLLQLKISALFDCVLFSPYIAWNVWTTKKSLSALWWRLRVSCLLPAWLSA